MNHVTLLDKTRAAFINHQGDATRRHYHAELRHAAVSLLKYYSPQALASQLNISTKSLRNWQEEDNHATKEPATFVPLTLSEDVTPCFSADAKPLVLKLPHQLELILPAKSIKDVAKFISHLIKEMAECSI